MIDLLLFQVFEGVFINMISIFLSSVFTPHSSLSNENVDTASIWSFLHPVRTESVM